MNPTPRIVVERDESVCTLRLNRPAEANCLDLAMATELAAAAAAIDGDPAVRAVVLTGTGRFFCAGGDVKAMAALGSSVQADIKRMADELHRAISTLARMRAPLVVAVNGVAAGAGLSLAAIGDLVVASDAATFTMAYTANGLSPDGSSTYYLPRVIGLRATQDLMLTNRKLTAAEALHLGLVTRTCPADVLDERCRALARSLAAGSSGAHAAVKSLLLATFSNPLETQMELEGRAIAACAASADGQEGIRAFVERRAPRFV